MNPRPSHLAKLSRAAARLALVGAVAASSLPARAQRPGIPEGHAEYVRSHYTKFEHRVPMRDGARLFTAVYLPNDTSKTYPIMLYRTPYGTRCSNLV